MQIDHFVLTVRDIDATTRFYCDGIGMKKIVFGEGRIALGFGAQKINLHQAGGEFEPHARSPVPGSADFCLLVDIRVDELIATLAGKGIDVIEGPVTRTGATGPLRSIYVRDPDGNLVELSNPTAGGD